MKLVLDTNIYCDYAVGNQNVVQLLAEFGEELYIPVVVIGELTYGFLKGNRAIENQLKLQEIMEALHIIPLQIDQEVARKYGLIYAQLVKKGRKIPINDVWIAASCLEIGGTLITRDAHFREIESLDVLLVT